jgi:hypothetical protein
LVLALPLEERLELGSQAPEQALERAVAEAD